VSAQVSLRVLCARLCNSPTPLSAASIDLRDGGRGREAARQPACVPQPLQDLRGPHGLRTWRGFDRPRRAPLALAALKIAATLPHTQRNDVRYTPGQHLHFVRGATLCWLTAQSTLGALLGRRPPHRADQLLQLGQVSSARGRALAADFQDGNIVYGLGSGPDSLGSTRSSHSELTLAAEPLQQLVACHITALVCGAHRAALTDKVTDVMALVSASSKHSTMVKSVRRRRSHAVDTHRSVSLRLSLPSSHYQR